MSQQKNKSLLNGSHFARTVVSMAAIGLILQACGQVKSTVANPAARAQNAGQTTPNSATNQDKMAQANNNSQGFKVASELTSQVDQIPADVQIVSVSKQTLANGQVQASVDLKINNEDLQTTLVATVGTIDPKTMQVVPVQPKFAPVGKNSKFAVSAYAYVNPQQQDMMYINFMLFESGNQNPDPTSQIFTLAFSSSAAYQKGQLAWGPVGANSANISALNAFVANQFQSYDALDIGLKEFEIAKDLKFIIGSTPVDVNITGINDDGSDNIDQEPSVQLMINGKPVSIADDNAILPAAQNGSDFDLDVQYSADPKNTDLSYLIVSLSKAGGAQTPADVRDFVIAVGTSNAATTNGVLMLDKVRASISQQPNVNSLMSTISAGMVRFPKADSAAAAKSAPAVTSAASSAPEVNAVPSSAVPTTGTGSTATRPFVGPPAPAKPSNVKVSAPAATPAPALPPTPAATSTTTDKSVTPSDAGASTAPTPNAVAKDTAPSVSSPDSKTPVPAPTSGQPLIPPADILGSNSNSSLALPQRTWAQWWNQL